MNTDNSPRPATEMPAGQVDEILDGLRPRMRAARVRHLRFVGALVLVVPMLAFGAAALASSGSDGDTEVAGADREIVADESEDGTGTDIGEASGEDGRDEGTDEAPKPEADDVPAPETDETPEPEPGPRVVDVDLATYGSVKVAVDEEGVSLIEVLLSDPWSFVGASTTDGGELVIELTDGETIKLVTIGEGLWDELSVKFDDGVPPTTTTVKPAPEPEPEPEPQPEPVVDRIVVEVSPAGSFVVERSGDTLWGGNVQPNDGYDHDIIEAEGWKVHVAFFDDTTVHNGKAYIDDNGELITHVWTEPREVPAEPVHQWVELDGVGAVKFKLLDGLMYVVEMAPAEGFESYVYNEVGETVKVDFEGEEQLWIVEAWSVEDTIDWSVSGPG